MEIGKYNEKTNSFIFLLIVGLVFFLLDFLNQVNLFKDFTSYIFTPIVELGAKYSSNTKNSLTFISDYKNSQRTIDGLKNKITQLESQNIGYTTLLERYNLLLSQSKTSSKGYKYMEASIYSTNPSFGFSIDKGKGSGIEVGDIVVLGNLYLGEIVKTDLKSSLIRRPQDVGSSLPVVIVKDKSVVDNTADKLKDSVDKSVKAVAVGRNEQIIIENIPNNGQVKNGDIVLVSSANIGGYLVLGKIDQLKNDPAASVLDAKVLPILDIYSVKFVYVRND